MARFYTVDGADRCDEEEKASEKASDDSFANDAADVTSHIGSLDVDIAPRGVPDLPVLEGEDVKSAKAASKHKRYKILALLGVLFVVAVVLVGVLAAGPGGRDASTAQGVVQANEQPQNEDSIDVVETHTETEDVDVDGYSEYDAEDAEEDSASVEEAADDAGEMSSDATTTTATTAAAAEEEEEPTIPEAEMADQTTISTSESSAADDPDTADAVDEDEMYMAAWDPESYDEPGKDELEEMGCYDSMSGMMCCWVGFFCG